MISPGLRGFSRNADSREGVYCIAFALHGHAVRGGQPVAGVLLAFLLACSPALGTLRLVPWGLSSAPGALGLHLCALGSA